MAKLTAPLMSFGASGKLGNSIVFAVWKGVPTARQYIVPSNPQTADQVAQRDTMTSVVSAWRRPALAAAIKSAWNKLAAVKTVAMSGFNAFTSNLVKALNGLPGVGYVVAVDDSSAGAVTLTVAQVSDGGACTEAGDFGIVFGDDPANLVNSVSVALAGSALVFDAESAGFGSGDVIYASVRKSAGGTAIYERAGIIEITLT